MEILVLMTCFNRKEKTLTCIQSLQSDLNQNFSFIVVDDKSTDGTPDVLCELANVIVKKGDGNLFYSGGMRLAIDEAKKLNLKKYDYVMLVNDDVCFYDRSVTKLINYLNGANEILVGATCDDNKTLSYGGSVRTSHFKPSYKNVMSTDEKVYCDTFCANCVLIPTHIFKDLNNIDPVYRHAMGDYDFGCAAKRSGYRILASNFFVGKCNDNPVTNTWKDSSLSRSQRLKMKESPKGLPLREWFYFLNKNHGFITAIVYSISGYVKIVLGK